MADVAPREPAEARGPPVTAGTGAATPFTGTLPAFLAGGAGVVEMLGATDEKRRVESIHELQRTVGNRRVTRMIMGRTAPAPVQRGPVIPITGFRVPQKEQGEVHEKLVPKLPGVDPQHSGPGASSDYIDNRVESVAYGIYLPGYLLYCSGLSFPLIVPFNFVDFGLTKAASIAPTDHANYEQAVAQLPAGPYTRDQERPFAYYKAPAGNVLLPTVFAPATAPVTAGLMRGAVLGLVAQVTDELEGVKWGIVVGSALRLALHGVVRIKFKSAPIEPPGLRFGGEPPLGGGGAGTGKGSGAGKGPGTGEPAPAKTSSAADKTPPAANSEPAPSATAKPAVKPPGETGAPKSSSDMHKQQFEEAMKARGEAAKARSEQKAAEPTRSAGPVAETFDTVEAAIGMVDGKAAVIKTVRTDNAGLRNQGFTETKYVLDADGTQWTVAHNPRTGQFTGAHHSSSN